MQTISASQLSGTMYPSHQENKIVIPISLDNIAAHINGTIGGINGLQTRATQLDTILKQNVAELKSIDNQNYQALYNRSTALYNELVSKDEAISNSLTQESANTKGSLQAQDARINVQSGQISDVQQRQVAADHKTTALEAQLIEEKAKSILLERKVQNLEGSDQQHLAKALETQNKMGQLEAIIQLQSKIIDEEQKEQKKLKQSLDDFTETLRQLSRNFDVFKDKAKAAQDELALKNAQLSEQAAEQEANIILMHKLAAEVVQEDQAPKQESPRKHELKARGLVRANSAKLLSKKN